MNVEQAFIKCSNVDELLETIQERLNKPSDNLEVEPNVGLPSSYKTIIALDEKRKVAVSEVISGWVSVIESKEVNDYKMLLDLSNKLDTKILCVVFSDITASWGFVLLDNGHKVESEFIEELDEMEEYTDSILSKYGIDFQIMMFREAVKDKKLNWKILKK